MYKKRVFEKTKVAQQVSASILALALLTPTPVSAQEDPQENSLLEEVVVTATRRSASQQDVPIALTAISASKLDELRIDSFDDYVELVPGVNATGQGPGKQEVFIRGISPGRTGVRIASLGSEPSVASYLDETPTSYAGRNVDLFATDLARIEVLKGPQGTLFGASSQAGTLRLITKKPVLNEFEAGVTVDLSDTSGGEGSESLEAYVNIPLIEDKLAFRLAAYNSEQGGFIDNIAATRQIALSNPALAASGVVPIRGTVDNAALVEDDFNDATYRGFRGTSLYQINENWSITSQFLNQTLDTEGIFDFEPEVSSDDDLNARTYNRDFGEDEVDLISVTVNGAVGDLDLIYNGSYTERLFEGQTDYTGYADVGPFIPYYICTYPGYATCGSPELFTDSFFETERSTHEFRISSDPDKSIRYIAGVYYDDQETTERTNFVYPSSVQVGFQPNFPIPDAFATDPGVRDPGVTFFNDFRNDREEISFFGEIGFDLSDSVALTVGARNYSIDINLTGQSSFGSRFPGPASAGGQNVDANLAGQTPTELSDTIFKVNLDWNVSDDVLLYLTYSEGFRSGGFNRNGQGPAANQVPFFFESDDALNYEFGWKTQFLDNSLQFNGALYSVDFTDLQQGVLDFSIDNITFFDNVGDADIQGLELDVDWAPNENLRLFGSFSYIDSELVELPQTVANISPIGSELPFAPEIQWTIGGRYETEVAGFDAFSQFVVKQTDDRFSSLVQVARFPVDSFTEVDASVGISTEKWRASLYIENLTDELGELSIDGSERILRTLPIRPRTVGVRFSYDY